MYYGNNRSLIENLELWLSQKVVSRYCLSRPQLNFANAKKFVICRIYKKYAKLLYLLDLY